MVEHFTDLAPVELEVGVGKVNQEDDAPEH